MFPVSAISLPSDLCLPTSFIDRSGRELKPLHITIPNVAMRRQGKLKTRASMSMNLRTAVSDDAVIRRRGDYHSNLWDYDLIQSLSAPYGEPSYLERAERLIGEVKKLFNSMSEENGELITPVNDLIQRLWMVDSVERLGIDRHFENEIESALDYVYRQGKLMTRASMSMNLRTAVSDDAVIRRRGDFHSNLWDDDFIESLSAPYGEPSYRERAERLIGEVKNSFNSMSNEDGESITPLDDLIQRLWMVDSVERLGIDRHFKKEIKSALDHVYSYWSEKGIGCGRESVVTDLNSTALGLRTLRLRGYDVSADVLNHFKNQSGQFACALNQTEDQIRTVLNLYRASLIAFPGEKVMDEAETFSAKYLKEAVQKIPVSSLSREIGDVLEYGWHTYLPRLEARNYIDVFGQDTENSKSYMKTEKLLELAKLEFNIFHALQKRELEYLVRWWKGSGSPQMTFCRHRHVEYYTLASCIAFEPQHSGFRLGFAKACHIITVLDDMYDTFGTLDELELFTSAIKRWDPSATECLPEYMKGVYMIVYNTVNEMSQEADKAQDRDTLNYCRQAWEEYLDAYMQEAMWIASGEVPTFGEYYENGKVSSGHRVAALQPILTTDIPFPEHVLKEVDIPSKLNDLASAILRLRGDTRCYQADRARGEEASCISCYMKDNPGTTEEDALNHINAMISDVIKGLNWELLKPNSSVPISAKKHAFDISRAFHYGYKYRDGYSVANIETKNLVKRTVIDPVTL